MLTGLGIGSKPDPFRAQTRLETNKGKITEKPC